ncbi:MAG: helix-turn-helix transcriptional regulator [Ruminococcaceae bacterium]|nr:helix-turn-helix transcriptional regulator [Oscillospiraceae bacterium]
MYISYLNLWKLLAEKELSKSDLIELTGLSSRVIAKLAKNETVTTDTIAKICTALSCNVGDIMECSNENTLSLYNYSRTFGEQVEENEHIKKIKFTFNNQKYVLYITKKSANKATRIYCEKDETIYWEQHYMMGGISTSQIVKSVLVKPERKPDEIAIVVIKGKPGIITGLDEGIWVSAKKGKLSGEKDIFVMSEVVFKVFSVQK